jgi:hypothetical protein
MSMSGSSQVIQITDSVSPEENSRVDFENDVLTIHVMDLLLINEGEECSTSADFVNSHNELYNIRIVIKYSGEDSTVKIKDTSSKRKLRRSITWDEKFPITNSGNIILEITLMKDNNPVLGTAIVDLSKVYLSCTESKIMVIVLSNQHNLDYNGLLIKSKLRIGLSKEDEKASNKVVLNKKNNMKAIKVHSFNPLRRKNTFDYMALMAEIFLIPIESEKFCSANIFLEFIKTFFDSKILIDIETIISNVISRSTHGLIANKACDETLLSPSDKLKWDVEKSCKFIEESFIVYFEYSSSCRFINSLDKSKVINYSEGIISDIDIKKSIVELQDSLTEYSNELKQTEDYFTEINKAIVDEKITTEAKVAKELAANTVADDDQEDTLPTLDFVDTEIKISILDKLCNMLAYKLPDISFTLIKTKITNILVVLKTISTNSENVKPIVKNLQNITHIIGQYYSRLNNFSVASSALIEDIALDSAKSTTVGVDKSSNNKALSTFDFCTRNTVMSVILDCCKNVEDKMSRSNIIESMPPRNVNLYDKKPSKILSRLDYHTILAVVNILHQCYNDNDHYKNPFLDDCSYYNRLLKSVCDLYDSGFEPITLLITAFVRKFESTETETIIKFINWLSIVLHITDLELNSRNLTRKLLLHDEKNIFQDLAFGDDEISSFLSYCKNFEESSVSSDFAELNRILDRNNFLEKMTFENGTLMHLACRNNLKKLTEVLISRGVVDLDIRDKHKRDYSWYARNNLELQKSILIGNKNKGAQILLQK